MFSICITEAKLCYMPPMHKQEKTKPSHFMEHVQTTKYIKTHKTKVGIQHGQPMLLKPMK